MLIQLRSAMTPSWPAVHCTFRSSQCSDQSTQRSHLQRIANIFKQSAPHIGNLLTFSHASATRWSRSKISWWAMKTFNCNFSLTPLWAEKYLAENPGPTAALHDVAVVELEFINFYCITLLIPNIRKKRLIVNLLYPDFLIKEFKQIVSSWNWDACLQRSSLIGSLNKDLCSILIVYLSQMSE